MGSPTKFIVDDNAKVSVLMKLLYVIVFRERERERERERKRERERERERENCNGPSYCALNDCGTCQHVKKD